MKTNKKWKVSRSLLPFSQGWGQVIGLLLGIVVIALILPAGVGAVAALLGLQIWNSQQILRFNNKGEILFKTIGFNISKTTLAEIESFEVEDDEEKLHLVAYNHNNFAYPLTTAENKLSNKNYLLSIVSELNTLKEKLG